MISGFTRKLLAWDQKSNKRAMPWKGERDPYKIWLSEIILQQTRVVQGLQYYQRFVSTFPTVEQLAHAPDEQIFKMWEGLGYYSRCKNMIATARHVSVELGGKFPNSRAQLKQMKGVGDYTAAAIASFAFDEPTAVVDGNVQRIIARYFGIATPVDSAEGKKLYNQMADALLDKRYPAKFNQAMMDFGALVCKPQNPLCSQCVQKKDCIALRLGYTTNLPIKEKTITRKPRWLYYFIIKSNNQVYIRKRTASDIWQNLHEFVLFETSRPYRRGIQNSVFFRQLMHKHSFSINHISASFRQQLTHQNISGQFIVVSSAHSLQLNGYIPVPIEHLRKYAFPRLITRFLETEAKSRQLLL